MTNRTKYHTQWRRAAKAALPPALRETRAYVGEETYRRIVEIAEETQERLPVAIGRLLGYAVAVLDGKNPDVPPPQGPSKPELKVSVEALLRALLASRFPDDTGAARLRQFAFVQMVAENNAKGSAPTATEMASLFGAHRSQMDLLSKQLQARGIITRKHVPGHNGAASAKLLYIADDALEQLNRAHIEATGNPIEGLGDGA